MSSLATETVLSVQHWSDNLFSFTATRDPSFRFSSGQFTMIGLKVVERPLLRAYSIASANHEDRLEFFSIKVDEGELTSRLQHMKPGDELIVGRKPTGTLVLESLLPGRSLYLLATGTGLAPFASIVRDPAVYDQFESVVLVHGCRHVMELGYGEALIADLVESEFFGEVCRKKLTYYPTVTREPFRNDGRITGLIQTGRLFEDIGHKPFDVKVDRVMMCGNSDLLRDATELLVRAGFSEGSRSAPGQYVVEKAFVEK